MDPRNLNQLANKALVPATRPAPALATIGIQSGDAVRQWLETKRAYEELRGVRRAANHKWVPRTQIRDIEAIAAQWSKELGKVKPRSEHERSDHKRWAQCIATVERLSTGKRPQAPYPAAENEAFWQDCTRGLAIYLESRKVVPSKWELAWEVMREIPSAPGRIAREAGDSVWGAVKFAALLGAGVVGAAIVLPPVIRAFR